MNRLIVLMSGAALMVGLTGCFDVSSPENTLKSAYAAIQKDDLNHFVQTLTPQFAQVEGSETELLRLRSELAGYHRVTLGQSVLTSVVQGPIGSGLVGDTLRTYTVPVLVAQTNGTAEVFLQATVNCDVMVRYVPDPRPVHDHWDHDHWGHDHWWGHGHDWHGHDHDHDGHGGHGGHEGHGGHHGGRMELINGHMTQLIETESCAIAGF